MGSSILRPLVLGAFATFAIVMQGACSTTAVQCLSESECLSRGAGFENTTCDAATKTCVAVSAITGACKTNAECIAANANQAAICRKSDRKCVVLQTAECPDILAGEGTSRVTDDNALVIGYIGVQNSAAYGVQHLRAARLAQADFTTSVKGIPSFDGSGSSRPVIIVGCNETNVGDDGLLNGAKHLVNDLEVPVIIGPIDSADIGIVRTSLAEPKGVMMLQTNSNGGGPRDPAPLYWGMTGSIEDFLASQVAQIDELAKRAVVRGIKTQNEPLRILLVSENTYAGNLISSYILQHLVFDGKPALEHDASTFRVADMGNPIFDPVTTPAPFSYVAANVLPPAFQLKPHIIIQGGQSGAFPPFVIQAIEDQWKTATNNAPRPLYHSPTPGTPATLPLVLGVHPDVVNRVFVELDTAENPPDPVRLAQWLARYNQANLDAQLTTESAQTTILNAYDAVYLAELAMTAVGNAPLTGRNVANAFLKLASGGPDVTDEPASIPNALATLSRGSTLTLNGLGGRFAFDPVTASPPGGSGLFCLKLDPERGLITKSTGISYSGIQKKQLGTWDNSACP